MSLFTPDTRALPNFEARGKFLMAWRFSLVFSFLFLAITLIIFPYTFEGGILYLIFGTVACGVLAYLKFTRNYEPVFMLYAILGTVVAQYSLNWVHDVTHFADLLWIFLASTFAFLAIDKLWGWIISMINMAGIGYFTFFEMNVHINLVGEHSVAEQAAVFIQIALGFSMLAYLVSQYVVFQTHSRLQLKKLNFNLEQQNEAVINQNKENITLIKEVHHRVKNNLQIIISLLRMQRSEIESEENQKQFTIAINRVMTMSLIHQKLYQEKEPSRINITDYIKDLASELLSVSNKHVTVSMNSQKEYADLKTIVPFGLLVNELISNSLKHAFPEHDNPESKRPEIRMEITKKSENELTFNYEDNGLWVERPEEDTSGFGLELIDVLTEQLDGSYARNNSSYTFEINTADD